MAIYETKIERDVNFIVLLGYEGGHPDDVLLELSNFERTFRGVLVDGCITTDCAAKVELYDSDVYSVEVVIAELEPQHFTLMEWAPTVDSPPSKESTIPDSDSTDPEFPIFAGSPMHTESEEDDTATSPPSDVPEDEEEDDDSSDSSMDTDPPASPVTAAPHEPMLLSNDDDDRDDGSMSSYYAGLAAGSGATT